MCCIYTISPNAVMLTKLAIVPLNKLDLYMICPYFTFFFRRSTTSTWLDLVLVIYLVMLIIMHHLEKVVLSSGIVLILANRLIS